MTSLLHSQGPNRDTKSDNMSQPCASLEGAQASLGERGATLKPRQQTQQSPRGPNYQREPFLPVLPPDVPSQELESKTQAVIIDSLIQFAPLRHWRLEDPFLARESPGCGCP